MDILLSTCDERICDIEKLIDSIDFDFCQLLIGHQCTDELSESARCFIKKILGNEKIKYFHLTSKGVTKNRNFLLKKSTADYIAFCDDDIIYEAGVLKKAIDIMELNNIDIITGITLTDERKTIKKYKKNQFLHNKVSILKVGTVEIIVRRAILNNRVFFPEDMGAGAKYPICDEPVFLSRCIDLGLSLSFVPIIICVHPQISSGMIISKYHTQSRGLCFKRIFGFKGCFLLFPFAIKMKIKNKKIKIGSFILNLFRGFNAD